jgi:flagellar biosynthetic protein FliP
MKIYKRIKLTHLICFSFTLFSLNVNASGVLQLINNEQWLDSLTPELRTLISLTLLSLIPAALIAMTAFTRIVIVLSMLRQALGLMQTPPNVVIITLSIFLTWFTMKPVFEQVDNTAVIPYVNNDIGLSEAVERAILPFRKFMISQTREEDFLVILEIAKQSPPTNANNIETVHLIPAFLISELRIAFQIAFVIFIPFLMIDLIVASTLMSLGMIMVPPISIALPIKIMVFVIIDGWGLVTQSLISSFYN